MMEKSMNEIGEEGEKSEHVGVDIVVQKELKGHKHHVYSVIPFENLNIIVTCSYDRTIRIWNKDTFEPMGVIKQKDSVNHLIKFSENTVVSCSSDGRMFAISFLTKNNQTYTIEKEFPKSDSEVVRMLRLSTDLFTACTMKGQILILSYGKGKIIKKYKERVYWGSKMVKSKEVPHSFYINTNDKDRIKLFNYEEGRYEKVFCPEPGMIHHMNISSNHQDSHREVLIASGEIGFFYFNTGITDKLIRFYKKVEFGKMIYASYSYDFDSTKYLFIGDFHGFLHVYNLKDCNYPKIMEKRIHGTAIEDINVWYNFSNNKLTKTLVTSSNDRSVKFSTLCVLPDLDFEEDKLNEYVSSIVGIMNIEIRQLLKDMVSDDKRLSDSDEISEFFEGLRTKNQIKELFRKILRNAVHELVGVPKSAIEYGYQQLDCVYSLFQRLEGLFDFSKHFENKSDKTFYFGEFIVESETYVPHGIGVRFSVSRRATLMRKSSYRPSFIGYFSNGKREGVGREFDITSRAKRLVKVFQGSWKNGLKEGPGIEYFCSSTMKSSSSPQLSKLRDFVIFEGQYRGGKKNGRGEMFDTTQAMFVNGIWKDGVLEKESVYEFQCPIIPYEDIKKHLNDANILGKGGFGVVYRVKSSLIPHISTIVSSEYVAVKVMMINSNFEKNILYRIIKRGIEMCARLEKQKNKHILKTLGMFCGRRQLGYVMNLCKVSVDDVIRSSGGILSIDEKIRILYETSLAMNGLHSLSIMHRDLKWDNVMLDFNDKIMLTDFDTLREDERQWRLTSCSFTSKIGTPGFVAPEVYLGKEYSLPCDVYSFGIMIYAIVFERPSYDLQDRFEKFSEEESEGEELDDHISAPNLKKSKRMEKILKKCPKSMLELMQMCWDKSPSRRPTFGEIVKILGNERKRKRCTMIISLDFEIMGYSNDQEENDDNNNMKQYIENLHGRRQKMLLVEPKRDGIIKWVENKYPIVVVKNLTFRSEELVSDEDVFRMVRNNQMESGSVVVDVTLEVVKKDDQEIICWKKLLEERETITDTGKNELGELRAQMEIMRKEFREREKALKDRIVELESKFEKEKVKVRLRSDL